MVAIVGWDIGGAHLKAAILDADGRVHAAQEPCPVWQGLAQLQAALQRLAPLLPRGAKRHAVTMTAELVDLFPDRLSGVMQLIDCLQAQFPQDSLMIYAGPDGFVTPETAAAHAARIASANWRASVAWLAQRASSGLFVDIGSTTSDLGAFADGAVLTLGEDDHSRLVHEELIYSGVVRTPLMAIASQAPVNGAWTPVMNEYFATTADVYRILGWLPEKADQQPAADGGEKTVAASQRRLARMLGLDAAQLPAAAWQRIARYFADRQLERLHAAASRILSRGLIDDEAPVITAGAGRFLGKRLARLLERPHVDYAAAIGESGHDDWLDTCAPAVAVARLLAD